MVDPYKTGAKSWDDVMLDFIFDNPPAEYLAAMAERLKHGHFIPAEEVYRKAGLR